MSREVRRVAERFDWPLGKVWGGYVQPEGFRMVACPAACANGTTWARGWVEQIAHLLLMLDDQRPDRPMHPYFDSVPGPYRPVHHLAQNPSADIREFGTGLAGREGGPFGHDAIDRWSAQKKIIAAAGLDPETWGICPTCDGKAVVEAYEGQAAEAEAWLPTEPPSGDWWQLWETVSEGSPVTPAFATPQALADHLAENPEVLGPGSGRISREQAFTFVTGHGWIPSGMADSSGFKSGAELLS